MELLITLALIGLVVGVVTVAIGRLSRASENRAALIGVVNALTVARVEAMRTSRPVRVSVEINDGVVRVDGGLADQDFRYRTGPLQLLDAHGQGVASAEAEFDSLGRTRERLWRIGEGEASSGDLAAQLGGSGKVRIWRIEFDPVSGAPVLRSPGEPGATPGSSTR